MYVYVRGKNIIHKSEERKELKWFLQNCTIYQVSYNKNDHLIFENGEIRIYEQSKQFEKDSHKYILNEKIEKLEFDNNKLKQIANKEVKKDLELKKEPSKFERELYLYKQMKQCWKHS